MGRLRWKITTVGETPRRLWSWPGFAPARDSFKDGRCLPPKITWDPASVRRDLLTPSPRLASARGAFKSKMQKKKTSHLLKLFPCFMRQCGEWPKRGGFLIWISGHVKGQHFQTWTGWHGEELEKKLLNTQTSGEGKWGSSWEGWFRKRSKVVFPLVNDAFRFAGTLSHRFRSPNSAAVTETPKATAVSCAY